MAINIQLDDGALLPEKAHKADAGIDIRASKDIYIPGYGCAAVPTGLHMQIPKGCFGKIESRSGLMFKHDIICPGGVIDSGYTGEIIVKLVNLSDGYYAVSRGGKIAQIIIMPFLQFDGFEVVESLEETERGGDGFGSTDV